MDITDPSSVSDFLRNYNPDVVIHTAALSDPDECERNHDLAEKINYFGTKNVVGACREAGSKLIYISTDYVFDGEKGNYSETDECKPVNFYGETKLRAEQEALTLDGSIILRFDILYGYNGPNKPNGFFSKVIRGGGLKVNADQKRQPLLVDDVGSAIQVLLEGNHSGIYHLAGSDIIAKYELATALEKIVRDESELVPVPEKEQLARRPHDVSLDTTKARSIGIKFHSVAEGVDVVRQQFESSHI